MTKPKPGIAVTLPVEEPLSFSCEKIAYWFFRLNGCLNLTNFLIHHEKKGREGTEVDVLGVRFPYRNEFALSGKPMADYELFKNRDKKVDIIIADSKRGICDLNDPWLDPKLFNMERILLVIGIFRSESINSVSEKLYKEQKYEDEHFRINLYTLGIKKNNGLLPAINQLTWEEVLIFIHNRFVNFEDYKTQHDQWDTTGKELFRRTNYFRQEPKTFANYVISQLTE